MSALLVTLGHNSSAIAVDDIDGVATIICGYEEERLSGIKSDSHFPEQAITKCLAQIHPDKAYVTHWSTDGSLDNMSRKHWQAERLDGMKIISLSRGFTHHDSHAYAAACFAGPSFPTENSWVMVIDGFGNFGEHLSIYHHTKSGPKLKTRYYGYGTSLGLMYQYATAYLGLKMHEDEYKLLGYEVHADKITREVLMIEAEGIADKMLHKMKTVMVDAFDPLIRLDALPAVQKHWIDIFDKIGKKYNLPHPHSTEGRAAYAFLIQSILECCVIMTTMKIDPDNLIVSGGVFYNVRLNYWLNGLVPGKFCVYPLAGDQGNAIGLYAKHNPSFVFPDNMNWGHRNLASEKDLFKDIPGLYVVDTDDEALTIMNVALLDIGYVNLVRGSMEFGPRALCNTSTISLPHMSCVERINHANGRNTVMPMAPVMTRGLYDEIFLAGNKVHKSEKYMVVSLDYKPEYGPRLSGAAHLYPDGSYTGRPQVIDEDPLMESLIRDHGVLINTSFNIHGSPIVYGMKEVIQSHCSQIEVDNSFITVVVRN